MLRSFTVKLDCWGGDKVVKETVKANDPNKAKQRAIDAVHKRDKVPHAMIKVLGVELAK